MQTATWLSLTLALFVLLASCSSHSAAHDAGARQVRATVAPTPSYPWRLPHVSGAP